MGAWRNEHRTEQASLPNPGNPDWRVWRPVSGQGGRLNLSVPPHLQARDESESRALAPPSLLSLTPTRTRGPPNACRSVAYPVHADRRLQPAMFNTVFRLAVPHSRLQRLAASQVSSPRDTCGAAHHGTPMMEWWSNLDTAEMSISYPHPSSPSSFAHSRHRDTGRAEDRNSFCFHPNSWEPGGWEGGSGGGVAASAAARLGLGLRQGPHMTTSVSPRLGNRVPLCRHPCRSFSWPMSIQDNTPDVDEVSIARPPQPRPAPPRGGCTHTAVHALRMRSLIAIRT